VVEHPDEALARGHRARLEVEQRWDVDHTAARFIEALTRWVRITPYAVHVSH